MIFHSNKKGVRIKAMKFRINQDIKGSIVNEMRRAGYNCLGRGQNKEEFSFVKALQPGGYPRFHLFVRFDQGKEPLFNLHLDQKKAVYKGTTAHSADHDGPVIDKEVTRIISILS